MKTHNELYEAALGAISDLFSDKSVSQEETKESLQGLIDEIDTLMDSLH